MSVLLTRKRVCAAKLEAVHGTAQVLADADGAENFFNPQFSAEIPAYERQGQGSMSALPSVPGAQSAKLTVQTNLYNSGSGTPPFWFSVLAPAAGFQIDGGTLTLLTGASASATIGHYVHGNVYEIAGAQGNLKIMGDKVGEPVKMDWEYSGLYIAPFSSSMLTPTYPTAKPPRFVGGSLSLGGVASLVVSSFELDLGNKVTLREDISNATTNTTGYIGSVITDRKPIIKMTVEVPPIGTHDFYNDLLTSVEAAFSILIGSGTNNRVTISAPKLQLRTAPQLSDKDGIFTYQLEYGLNRDAAEGDDELTIVLS